MLLGFTIVQARELGNGHGTQGVVFIRLTSHCLNQVLERIHCQNEGCYLSVMFAIYH